MEMRCDNKLLGVILVPASQGVVELKCRSRFCGAGDGAVVLHRFSTENGELLETRRYKDTPRIDGQTRRN